jgi:hypothetical protein
LLLETFEWIAFIFVKVIFLQAGDPVSSICKIRYQVIRSFNAAGNEIIINFGIIVFQLTESLMSQRIEMQICLGSSCFSRGNKEVVQFIKDFLKKNHLDDRVIFKGARCMGLCNNGPNLTINGKIYNEVTLSQIESIMLNELGNLK